MVERVTYRRRHSYATKSNKVRKVKTPGAFAVCVWGALAGFGRATGPRCPRGWRWALRRPRCGGGRASRDAWRRNRAHANAGAGSRAVGLPLPPPCDELLAAGGLAVLTRATPRVCVRCAQAPRRASRARGGAARAFFFLRSDRGRPPLSFARRRRALPAGLPARRSTSRAVEPAPPRTPGGRDPGAEAAAKFVDHPRLTRQFPLSSTGGRLVVQYLRKKPSAPKCGATGVALHGVSVLNGERGVKEGGR